ncbi:MarR family winged helix-turn-helix transcriptional regulator [Mycobacterium szulgai]|uniref:HTH marR-type domain-containing protein n=1 Tax=Mycobacterium szulgai TaxID=1787 RepID=A0A1X2DIW0_MYCSZ|nr:MarR family transcriptional regulator [Mycobacterium szulgai]MCV7079548.1 MarR family transcriptional regulator [Mycobacterium szulgai]ORW88135.1 hypothetical protein AWC27_14900 [Mycobacterium szulgai]
MNELWRQQVQTPDAETAFVVDCFGRRLTLAARNARQTLDSHLARAGTTYAGWSVLATLHQQGPLMQRELAQRLDIEGPTLTRQLERLERQGLVTRRRVDSDRRVALVELTPSGQAMVSQLQEVVAVAAKEVGAGLTTEQLQELGSLLDLITAR